MTVRHSILYPPLWTKCVDPFPTPEYTVHVSLSHVILTLTLSPYSTVMLNTHKHQNSIHVYRSVSQEPHIFFILWIDYFLVQ